MSSVNGKDDATDLARSSSVTITTSEPPQQPQETSRAKHSLRLPGMPPIGIPSSRPLVGTPYSFTHPPFEYPFPSPSSTSAPSQHLPLYIPSLEKSSKSPFPFAPTLLPHGNGRLFGHLGVESLGLGLGLPMWRRSASPSHPKFQPSRVEPPVPPGLKQRVKEKAESLSWVSPGSDERGEKERAQSEESEHGSRVGQTDENGSLGFTDQEDTSDSNSRTSRPQSPDLA